MGPRESGRGRMSLYKTLSLLVFPIFWGLGGLDASAVGSEKGAALDYVSLTDLDRSVEPIGEVEGGNATTWVVGGVTECSKLPSGCYCTSQYKATSVICSYSNQNPVVNLKPREGSSSTRIEVSEGERWTWEVKGCSKVILHQNFLSSFFGKTSSLKLHLKFTDIQDLVIHGKAFTLQDSGSLSNETIVEFNNCDIEKVPSKAFPTYLYLVKFINCRIGTLSQRFIATLKLERIHFENSTIEDVATEAFSNVLIGSFTATETTFKKIRTDATITSGIQVLNWTNCVVDHIEKQGLSGSISHIQLQSCKLRNIHRDGFSVTAWSFVQLVNNTFETVKQRGVNLALHATNADPKAFLIGNSWKNVEKDFIIAGIAENPFAVVENNTFQDTCSCGSTFTSLLSLEESKAWFSNQLFEASRCPLDAKLRNCFQTENGTDTDGFAYYNELSSLCSTELYMCMTEVNEMHVNPKLPNRLEVLALFIGAFVVFMVVSLLLTLLVYMVRKKGPRKEDGNGDLTNDIPRMDFSKSLNPDPYMRMTKTPSMPTRIALLEDVEMEDKGVQTLPTDLSADIIEGLKEKFGKPDGLWDAQETIGHLYDLIHVRDQATISSPPDVTCNESSENMDICPRNTSTDSLRPLVTPVKRNSRILPIERAPMRTFAQQTTTSPTSENGNHIYSELGAFNRRSRGLVESPTTPPPLPTTAPPIICDYTEPRDFQAHIYAELLCSSQPEATYEKAGNSQVHNNGQYGGDLPRAANSSVILKNSPRRKSANLNDLNLENKTFALSSAHSLSNIPEPSNAASSTSSKNKRPLPSIPPKPARVS